MAVGRHDGIRPGPLRFKTRQDDLGFGTAGRGVASAGRNRAFAARGAVPDPVSVRAEPSGGIAPRTFARATRSGGSRYVSACTSSSGTVCRPGGSPGTGDIGCVTTGSSSAAARIDDPLDGIGAVTTADAGSTTAADARIAARSPRRGLITRAARLNTLRVAVS